MLYVLAPFTRFTSRRYAPALFAAGVLPGLLVGACLAIPAYVITRRRGWRGDWAIDLLVFPAGYILDGLSIYYIFVPIIMPIMAAFGWDPVWIGVMLTVNIAIGQVTPLVAVNVYVDANIARLSFEEISRAVWPFVLAMLLALGMWSSGPPSRPGCRGFSDSSRRKDWELAQPSSWRTPTGPCSPSSWKHKESRRRLSGNARLPKPSALGSSLPQPDGSAPPCC